MAYRASHGWCRRQRRGGSKFDLRQADVSDLGEAMNWRHQLGLLDLDLEAWHAFIHLAFNECTHLLISSSLCMVTT
eukprot:scaffold3792_cov160-Skeletonema_menzelii.AAC.8